MLRAGFCLSMCGSTRVTKSSADWGGMAEQGDAPPPAGLRQSQGAFDWIRMPAAASFLSQGNKSESSRHHIQMGSPCVLQSC